MLQVPEPFIIFVVFLYPVMVLAFCQYRKYLVEAALLFMDRHFVLADLDRYGPGATAAPPDLAESQQYCCQLARRHYENFTVVGWLLPRRLRQHFYNVYSWCRWADDLADEIPAAAPDEKGQGGGAADLGIKMLQW